MSEPTRLPIYDALSELRRQLSAQTRVVLEAPPGAGKSTVLPLELRREAWLGQQRILMLEPRRIAASSVATRMAQTLGEAPGQTVGYRVRFEQRVSAETRIEVLTEGILTRRIQGDPSLDGIGLIIFDEFHERSLHADLALALCREAQSVLRPDLRILIMSATLDGVALSRALDDAPIVRAEGRQFPVSLHYAARDPEGPIDRALVETVDRALANESGDILAFLPGLAEIQRARDTLVERHPGLRILTLHGDLPLDQQQAVLQPDTRGSRRVILATSIAETSLTINGIHVVVDSGLSRTPRFDPRSGLTRLETTRVAHDSANQRAGRAGRLSPGVCYRLWTEQTQQQLAPARRPEILDADLAPARLEMAQWGARRSSDLRWITPPPAGAFQQAETLLRELGALDGAGALTAAGAALLSLPTHPRLAHMLDVAQDNARRAALACDVAALLDERDPLPRGSAQGSDLSARVDALRRWRANSGKPYEADARVLARVERLAQQWRKHMKARMDNGTADAYEVGWLLAQAYPERVAQRRDADSGRYKLASGRGVQLLPADPLAHAPLIAVAHADAGQDDGKVYLAAPLDAQALEEQTQEREIATWDAREGVLVARRERRYGALTLSSKPTRDFPLEERSRLLREVVQAEGMLLFDWGDAARQLQARIESLRIWQGSAAGWPTVSDDALLADPDAWLQNAYAKVTRRADFGRINVVEALSALLSYALRSRLDTEAPTHRTVASGSHIRLTYAADGAPPVMAVKLQELFGEADTPTVNNGRTRVLIHLLSPAQRPIQVTQDLRNFWNTTYPEVRKELRGRYNKHPWPEDPWNATPTARTVKRMRQ